MNATTAQRAALETDDYTIITFKDDQFLTWNAKLITEFPNYYITDCGKVFSTNINEFLKPSIKTGYKAVALSNSTVTKRLCIHRLVAIHFLGYHGPELHVDHKDRDKLNNHLSNLRWVTPQQNCFNLNKKPNTSSNYLGVSANNSGTFSSAIKRDGKKITLGSFRTQEEASEAYQRAKQTLHSF